MCLFIHYQHFLYISFRISFIPETGKEPYMVTSLTLIYNDKYIFFYKNLKIRSISVVSTNNCLKLKVWISWYFYECLIKGINGAVPGPYVPVRVTCGALVAHGYTYAPRRCRTSQYRRTFILLSVSLWNDLANPVFEGVGLPGLAGFKSSANAFLLA